MITHKTINGKDVEINVAFGGMGIINWKASHAGRHITGGTTSSDSNDLSEAIPEIVEMIEISLGFDGMDVCAGCGRSVPRNTDCPTCLQVRYDAADFAASAREWERDVLQAS